MSHRFAQFANWTGRLMGTPQALIVNVLLVIAWAAMGPLFDYSTGWQLVINTGTTIFTYLLLFVVQNTQNRNSAAIHVKLDEILRAIPQARTMLAMAALEDAPDDVIARERQLTQALALAEHPGGKVPADA